MSEAVLVTYNHVSDSLKTRAKKNKEEETHYIPFSWKEFLLSLEVKCELNAGILKNFQQPLK